MLIFLLTLSTSVSGVFSVPAASVSVIEGQSVTLNTGVAIAPQEDVKWYFNDIRIAQMNGDHSFSCTDVQCKGNERFRDRVKVDHQTGSLTITNIKTGDSGGYHLRIINSSKIRETIFNVTVLHADDVDKIKEISVKERESVTLDSGVINKTCHVMTWYFNNTLIAKDPSTVCLNAPCEDGDERFRDRLKLDNQTGSLTITNIIITDSGEYKLKISCQIHSLSISSLKVFSVTVTGLASSLAFVGGTCTGIILLLLVIIALICCFKHRARRKGTRMKFSKVQSCCLRVNPRTDTTLSGTANDTRHNGNELEDEML